MVEIVTVSILMPHANRTILGARSFPQNSKKGLPFHKVFFHEEDSVLALTVKIRKSQDFLVPISGSPGDQFFHSLSEIQPQYS